MKEVVGIGGRLAAICAVAAIALGIVNAITEPIIIEAREQRLRDALSELSVGLQVGDLNPDGNDTGTVSGFYPLTENGEVKGYIVSVTGSGYGGDMNILTAVSTEGKIMSVVLMDNSETPGLGKEAEKASYMEKFIGTGGDSVIPTRKSQLKAAESEAITGASITFIGIGKALNEAAGFAVSRGGK